MRKTTAQTVILIGLLSNSLFFGCILNAQEAPYIYIQTGHTNTITAVDQSPDMRYIVTASEDKTLKLWDYQTGKEIRTFEGHANRVKAVMFSPDGKMIVSGSYDGTVRLWDINSGKEIRKLSCNIYQIEKVFITSDGRYILASGDFDRYIQKWDMNTGEPVKTLSDTVFTGPVAFSPDGKYALAKDIKNDLRVWDTDQGKVIKKLKGHKNQLTHFDISCDGKYAVSADLDGKIIIWDAVRWKERTVIKSEPLHDLVISADGKKMHTHGFSGIKKIWSLETGKEIKAYKNFKFGRMIKETRDGTGLLYTSVYDVNEFHIETEKDMRFFRRETVIGDDFCLSPDGRYLFVPSVGGEINIWDQTQGKVTGKLKGAARWALKIILDSKGQYAFASCSDSTVKMWDLNSGRLIRTFRGLKSAIRWLSLSPDDGMMATVGWDHSLIIWDISTGKDVANYRFPGEYYCRFPVFSPDSRGLLMGFSDTIAVMDVKTGRISDFLSVKTGYINLLTFSPDGRYLYCKENQGSLIKIDYGKKTETLRWTAGSSAYYGALACSPDGKSIVSTQEFDLILWDTETGSKLKRFEGHHAPVNGISYTPDGKYILSGAGDHNIIIWDIQTGQALIRYYNLPKGEWLCITPDGYFSASPDGAKYVNVRVGNNVYSVDNFFNTYYRPDLIREILSSIDISRKMVRKITEPVKLPPQVSLFAENENGEFIPLSESGKYKIKDEYLTVKVTAKDIGGGISGIRVYHNDKITGEDTRGMKAVSADQTLEITVMIPLTDGPNKIRAVAASSDQTESNPIEAVYTYIKPKPPKPNMYVLGIGINEYMNTKYNLNFCVADCQGFLKTIGEKAAKLFDTVSVSVLLNADATRDKFSKTVESIQKRIKPEDVFVFFYAGHGIALETADGKNEFFYVLHDVTQMTDVSKCRTSGLSGEEMRNSLKNIKATKQILFVDACNSGAFAQSFAVRGAAEENALAKLSRASGSVVIASTTSTQFAKEFAELNHGVFTYTLLEALSGKASKDNGEISVARIKEYIDDYVPQYTKQYKGEAQWPTTFMFGMDFPVGVK